MCTYSTSGHTPHTITITGANLDGAHYEINRIAQINLWSEDPSDATNRKRISCKISGSGTGLEISGTDVPESDGTADDYIRMWNHHELVQLKN